jgi:exodeoxyribonuclease V alpha subunit
MSYADSQACQQQLPGIEAIDYFLAQDIMARLSACTADKDLLFHMLLAVSWALRQGHSCLPLAELASRHYWPAETTGLDCALDEANKGYRFPSLDALQACLTGQDFSPSNASLLVVYDFQALYVRRYWQFECEVASHLSKRVQSPLEGLQTDQVPVVMARLFGQDKHSSAEQQQAIEHALKQKLGVICGGPGTGKTYTVTFLLAVLQSVSLKPLKTLMAAPTGKAAQRLNESIVKAKSRLAGRVSAEVLETIPEQAVTLHRLLGVRPQSTELQYHAGKPLLCDVLLIDEVSMIDLPMMTRLLRALPEHTLLILLGDSDQLPSIETGSVLRELSHCRPPLPGFSQLRRSHRVSGEIKRLADEVIAANIDGSWQRLQAHECSLDTVDKDHQEGLTYLPDTDFDAWLVQTCVQEFAPLSAAKTKEEAFSQLAAFRILLPMRIGERGVEAVNRLIRRQLGKPAEGYYHGQPVMLTANNYPVSLYNGDVGLIWRDENGNLMVWFEDDKQSYRPVSLSRLPHLETVYAMTIHKTQGSEFRRVALVLPHEPCALLSPELLYTGLTRASEQLTVLTHQQVWQAGLRERAVRYSGLGQRLSVVE